MENPVTIVIRPGQSVRVVMHETDGEFLIKYGEEMLTVETDLPDTQGREGVIYCEDYSIDPSTLSAEALQEASGISPVCD